MKKFLLGFTLFLGWAISGQAQDDKYKSIQGIGYLHTQTALILNNWKTHPLNHEPMSKQEAVIQSHFLEEFEHDEEWVDIVLVESNVFEQFKDHMNEKVEDAIRDNLEFYKDVLEALKYPDKISDNREAWLEDLVQANIRLYDVIYPALCK